MSRTISRRQISMLISTVIALIALLTGGREITRRLPQADVNTPVDESHALVFKVVDGDTFELENGQKVRLIGIDTPESVDPRKPVQYFGKEASQYAKELIEKRYVTLTKDVSETDKYHRLLRYVYLGDGTFVNEKLLRDGYAHVLTFPPDTKFNDLFLEAERDARDHKRGLWQ